MKLKFKKSVFFVNSSPEAIAHLVQKAIKIKQEITPNRSLYGIAWCLKQNINVKITS